MVASAVTESCVCMEMYMLPEGLIAPARRCSSARKEHLSLESRFLANTLVRTPLAGAELLKTEV